jgi:hypothetical protein
MSAIRAAGLGSVRARPGPSRNGLPGGGYVYQGTGRDRPWPDPPRRETPLRSFTVADAGVLAAELPALGAAVAAAVREAP